MRKLQSRFVFALLFAFILSSFSAENFVYAQNQDQAKFAEKIKRIEKFVETQMKSEGSVGLTIGFIKDDFQWVKGFGYADLENKVPAKIESSYRMASVTKPMTAIGILRLVEAGKINLDDEVQKYVPYFPKKKYPVTVRQLLGHLGGISHYQNYALEGHFKDYKNTRESIAVFENFDLITEPGTQYNYSSYGFNLLGAVIEGASGKSYGEYMTENVWKPLGMKDTILDNPLEVIPNRVEGYQMINGKIKNSEFVDISSRFAGGGTRSTVPDMLAFAKNLYDGKLLSDKMRSEMWTAQSTRGGRNVGYGYGWGTNTANGRFVVGHGGAQAETRTYVLAVPHQKFAAAVAINFENADSAGYVTKIFEIIIEEPWSIRMFAPDQKYAHTLRGMDSAFDFGMRYYDQFGKPQTTDANELKEAFAYFNETLKMPKDEALPRLQNGSHPASKEAFVKMISFMADKLKQNGKNLDDYYDGGVIPLFSDYISWYKTQPNYSNDLKFESSFEQQIARWNTDWAKTWNNETRELEIFASTDFKALDESLSKTFSGASVYPDFVNDLDNQVTSLAIAGDFAKAFEVAQLNYKLYPESDKSNATLGTLYILAGQKEKALPVLKKSLEINPRGDASAAGLNAMAYNLLGIGQTEAGLQLLLTAVELHPKEANLYDSIGEFYMTLKQNEKAIEFYQKALDTNPNYPNAKVARETLEKLKNK